MTTMTDWTAYFLREAQERLDRFNDGVSERYDCMSYPTMVATLSHTDLGDEGEVMTVMGDDGKFYTGTVTVTQLSRQTYWEPADYRTYTDAIDEVDITELTVDEADAFCEMCAEWDVCDEDTYL